MLSAKRRLAGKGEKLFNYKIYKKRKKYDNNKKNIWLIKCEFVLKRLRRKTDNYVMKIVVNLVVVL